MNQWYISTKINMIHYKTEYNKKTYLAFIDIDSITVGGYEVVRVICTSIAVKCCDYILKELILNKRVR